ncbi:hypothetical protein [Priestia megaterium]|uniref:hypothetical protein n=1 Tax=Priestia megaterium TaxID=1404 RepID=UPI000BF5CC06|nr:hypothetical protein [Priestia megaterium]PFW51996.1 hypothetical protein COL17_05120 [Priestia megaterium]UMZ34183.1 hypothetical protein MGJ28_05650 [Priestia megaterium]
MGILTIFQKSKKEIESFIIATGRDLGCFRLNEKREAIFAVGSLFDLVQMTKKEYKVWKELKASRTISNWAENCINNNVVSDEKEFEQIKLKFKNHRLFENWDKNSILQMKEHNVSKNGVFLNYSSKEDKWIISSFFPKRSISLNQEQYEVWRAAVGTSTIADVVKIVANTSNNNEKNAIEKVIRIAPILVERDLWNIEFFGKAEKYYANEKVIADTIHTEFFDSNSLSANTNIVSLGDEIGYESTSIREKDNMLIMVANKVVTLNSKEHAAWVAFRKGVLTIQDSKEIFSVQLEEMISVVKMLMDKRVVMKWPESLVANKQFVLSVGPKGIGIGTKNNKEYKILDVTNGEGKFLPYEAYMVWAFSHGYVPIAIIIEKFKMNLNYSQEDASYRVTQWVRLLLNQGLVNLTIIPDNPLVVGWKNQR